MSAREFYHVLDLACIEALECDLPLNIGFNIQHFLKQEFSWRYGSLYHRVWVDVRHDIVKQRNNNATSKIPRHVRSNSGAGYW